MSQDWLHDSARCLNTRDLAAARAVSRHWHSVHSREGLWREALARDFHAPPPLASTTCVAEHARLTRLCAAVSVPWPFLRRANVVFHRLRALAVERRFPGLLARLRPGATPATINSSEHAMGRAMPPSLKAVLLAHDGHDSGLHAHAGAAHDVRHTFLGGYAFYRSLVAPFLLPAEGVSRTTKSSASVLAPRYVIATWNSWGAGGVTVLDSVSGGVYAMCGGGRMVRACPEGGASEEESAGVGGGGANTDAPPSTPPPSPPGDAYLRWLEVLVDRLVDGTYAVCPLPPDVEGAVREAEGEEEEQEEEEQGASSAASEGRALAPVVPPASVEGVEERPMRAVSLFPEPGHASAEGLASVQETDGVVLTMGCVFVPHLSRPGAGISVDALTGAAPEMGPPGRGAAVVHNMSELDRVRGRYSFGYRARMRYAAEHAAHASVQLTERHWYIHDGSGKVEQVHGAGVIGHHPHLSSDPAAPPFEYASASSAVVPEGGKMLGSFTFVPGTMVGPTGQPFEAEVAEWALRVPDYIYG